MTASAAGATNRYPPHSRRTSTTADQVDTCAHGLQRANEEAALNSRVIDPDDTVVWVNNSAAHSYK